MKKPLIGLIAGLLLGICVTVRAQDATSATVVTPCPDDRPNSRLVLKKRQPTPENRGSSEVEPSGDQVKCQPNKDVAASVNLQKVTMKFEGLVNVNESNLRLYLEEHQGDVRNAVPPPSPAYFDAVAALIREFLEESGYRHAKVTLQAAKASVESPEAIFLIDEGARPSIAEYRFEGNHVFSSATLAEDIRQCMVGYERDYYDANVFDYCIHKLMSYERGFGYLQARFGDPKIVDTNGGLVITVPAEEGILYRVGEIKFECDLLTPNEKVPTLCPIKGGEIANGELLSKWLFRDLKQLYGELGYIQYTAEVNPEFRTTPRGEGVVDLAITIDAGHRFKVRRIRFAGENVPDNLPDLMLIHDGDIYNQSLFERSIDALNNTGLFEFIDKDKDTDYKSNDEEGLLDITIKLTRKNAAALASSRISFDTSSFMHFN